MGHEVGNDLWHELKHLLTIPGAAVEKIVMKEPALLLSILKMLSNRLKESMSLIESLALRKMHNDGVMEVQGRQITILNHMALEELSEGE